MPRATTRFSSHQKEVFATRLLKWWSGSKRDFPWRGTSDPFRILMAELLLRKTTAKQVEAIYEGFLSSYPNSEKLSKASQKELENAIRPLGMEHKKATLLKAIGTEILQMHSGRVPTSREELMELPGVGAYVANAVLCFAYDKDVPLVDTNAIRVFQRVFGFQSKRKRPKDDPSLWSFAESVIPPGRARDLNLAIIDHAHTICLPRKPNCSICPLKGLCVYTKYPNAIEEG